MDNGEIMQLIGGLVVLMAAVGFYLFKKHMMKFWYTYKGKSKKSFLYHGIALCYEQLELDTDEQGTSIPKISDVARWHIDNNGHGTLWTEEYILKTNSTGGTDIIVPKALVIDAGYQKYAEDLCKQMTAADDGINYQIVSADSGKLALSITCSIDADPTETDARYYISGIYENTINQKRQEFNSAYYKYKKQHPYNIV